MSDLVEWLTSILDEDEAIAGQGPGLGHPNSVAYFETDEWSGVEANSRWLLADIAAKRAIITLLWAAEDMAKHTTGVTAVDAMHEGRLDVATAVVRRLAAAYADRPGYDESWRP